MLIFVAVGTVLLAVIAAIGWMAYCFLQELDNRGAL